MAAVLGLIALAIILTVIGLDFTLVKWLLLVAAVLFILGTLRGAMNRGGSTRHT